MASIVQKFRLSGICGTRNLWYRYLSNAYTNSVASSVPASHYDCSSVKVEEVAKNDMIVINNFISEDEEVCLMGDIEPKWRRLKYQFDHWDNAIQGYRETEVSKWSERSESILQRLRDTAYPVGELQRTLVHVLDLAPDGFIKPHVDSVRFCGRVIAGLSLLSPCVMRFINEENKSETFSTLLDRRSLYIMKDRVRYKFTHEILKNEESIFRGQVVNKGRRISVICRSEVDNTDSNEPNTIFKPIVMTLDDEK